MKISAFLLEESRRLQFRTSKIVLFIVVLALGLTVERPGLASPYATSVAKIQYRNNAGDYVDSPPLISILKGTSMTFKAIPSPTGKIFDTGQPVWGGVATGTGETSSVTFDVVSTSSTDYKAVTAKVGTSDPITVNVVVYELTPTTTPTDDFFGRDESDYGIGEVVSLTFATSPIQVDASVLGGLTWSLTGLGTLVNATGNTGTGTHTADNTAHSITLTLTVTGGPSQGIARHVDRGVILPASAFQVLANETPSIWHVHNKWSAGFHGDYYIGPKTVSFHGVSVKEETCQSTATGWIKAIGLDNYTHNPGSYVGTAGNGNATLGCWWGLDKVMSGAAAPGDPLIVGTGTCPAYDAGTFTWPIPLSFHGPGDTTWHSLCTVNQTSTSSATGSATASKAGASSTSAAADAASTPPGW